MSYLTINFKGWFQSRFATGADTADDPRGTRGFIRALPGEPDFDRIIRFQPEGAFCRSHIDPIQIGVTVSEVYGRTGLLSDHQLLGARVSLEDNPVFKGENGIVADDGDEPIVPFTIRIQSRNFDLIRNCSDEALKFPFTPLRPLCYSSAPGQVMQATGIYDFLSVLKERIRLLEEELKTGSQNPALHQRIKSLVRFVKGRVDERFFYTTLLYQIYLGGSIQLDDPENQLPQPINRGQKWLVNFWMGGFDLDSSCGFVQGSLSIPLLSP
jgi:hypothetical protein